MDLTGRTALLTGAAGGIGHHIADALALRGARLIASDVDEAELGEAALPAEAVRVAADLRDPAEIERLVAEAGEIHVLVNCAGLEYTGAYAQQEVAEIDDIVRVNLLAPMLLIRAVLPGMLARGDGHVVNIASIAGKGPAPFLTAYGTTKAGLIGLTRSLRVEHRGSGVRFSAVSPGFVAREGMYARMAAGDVKAPFALGTVPPERVAHAVIE